MSPKIQKTDSIYTEYFDLTEKYTKLYGDRTIVLLQVGAFFEVYASKHSETGNITKSEIEEFAKFAQLTISDKKIADPAGFGTIVMSGFRDYTLEKYLQKITENSMTAVVYVQNKDNPKQPREFNSVHSPGTYISYDTDSSPRITNNIMCIWLDSFTPLPIKNSQSASPCSLITAPKGGVLNVQRCTPLSRNTISKTRDTIIYGISTANIFTGETSIFEYQTPFFMNPTTFDELERYVSVMTPSEVIIISTFDEKTTNTIIQYSGLKCSLLHKIILSSDGETSYSDKVLRCTKQNYIQHILSSFFGEEAQQICVEFQTHTFATQSFCYLLNFIQEHNPDLVRKIAIPTFNNTSSRMVLANHTLKQLNIIDDSSMDGNNKNQLSSVLSFLNKCCSPIGRRRFQIQLTNPTFDEKWLNTEYQMITELLSENYTGMITMFRKQISQIRDLEKICRQIVLRKIYPSSIYHLYNSIQIIQQINVCLFENQSFVEYLCSDFVFTEKIYGMDDMLMGISKFIENYVDIEKCRGINSVLNFNENIIKKGQSSILDSICNEHCENLELFHSIHLFFNKIMRTTENSTKEDDTEYIRIHETEKSGKSLQITKKRGLVLKKLLSTIDKNGSGILEITPQFLIPIKDIRFINVTGSNDEIEFPQLTRIIKQIMSISDKLNEEISKVYLDFLRTLEKEWYDPIENIVKYIAKLDVLQSKVYVAREYNYCCPTIDSSVQRGSIDATDLRHVLIEQFQQNEIYVTNNVCLGGYAPYDGMLLYGTNAVGKTSLIRAVGIAIILAQAGMFVPCSKFRYNPYTSIYSRILGNDNIFKGLSTFAVEMSELRIILKMADENSLILGDELCSGTESESALSIFTAGLMDLHSKHATFLFATHFHEIIKYDEIRELTRMSLNHMSVHYDVSMDCLVYDRKLKEGAGNRVYGLEVCRSLYLGEDFLEKAYAIRNKYHPDIRGELSQKPSVYNVNKIRGVCEICKGTIATETHHLSPQQNADENGFIGSFHKNHRANLASVCEKCHDSLHNIDVPVKYRKKTTDGYKIIEK